jgi:hypothetical protein
MQRGASDSVHRVRPSVSSLLAAAIVAAGLACQGLVEPSTPGVGTATGGTSGPGSGTGGTGGTGAGSPTGTGNSPGTGTGASVGTGGGGSGGVGGAAGTPVVFAPAPGAYRRLTASAFRNSLRDLLQGPVTVGALEPDSWSIGGFATVSAATVAISATGVERYQAAIDAATAAVFADAARRTKILGCTPKNATDTACFQSFVTKFGRLAWRQPLTPAQVTRHTNLITTVTGVLGDVNEGMRAAMQALLLSPNFIYRMERGTAPAGGGNGFWRYTGSEIATRLSYFLTNTTPDTTLLDLAEQDGLQTKEAILAQTDRLLASTAGRESIASFATDLYQLEVIASRAKDPKFTEYTPALQTAMIQEIPAMFQAIVFDRNASALELLTTRDTFVTKELAALYGLPTTGLTSTALTATTLPATGQRAGLLTTAGFLSLFAKQDLGSPTLRGKFIRETILCGTIAMPPPNVTPELPELPPGVVQTTRERLTAHQTVATCAFCHKQMDPLGLPLENFDAIGKYRATDQGLTLDLSGEVDGKTFNGPVELGQALAAHPAAGDCLVRNMYRYGTGHVETGTEQPVLESLKAAFRTGGYHMRDLMRDIVSSDGFRFVAAPAP